MNKLPITVAAALLIWADVSFAGILIMKRAWIEKFKDRATIDASFTVDAVHKHANAAKADGDMHIAGHAPKEIGLPMVAEMVNAVHASTEEAKAITSMKENKGTGNPVKVSGAWRLWFEHPAHSQTQFKSFDPVPDDTNPDHSFEIHPLTKFDGKDLTSTFRFVQGFEGYDAATAFGDYEKGTITLRSTASAVTLESKKMVRNYAHFRMHLRGKPKKLDDGGYAGIADVSDEGQDEDEALVEKVRMIFVPDTPPWKLIDDGMKNGSIGDGSELDALGIPRVNLNAIFAFIKEAGNNAPPVKRKLPYEMIIVAAKQE